VSTGTKNISRVRLEAQQRLDLPDFNALQALVDESVQQQIGNAFGCGGGLLSPMQFTLSDDGVSYWIQPGAFAYYWSKKDQATIDGTYRAWKGGVGTYDPAVEGQTYKWDYTAARAAAITPTFVYVRPKAVDTATDARRKFTGGAEASVSLKTRTAVVHEFKFATTSPEVPENDGWAPVMVVTNWAAVATSPQVSVWDSYNAFQTAEGSNPFYDTSKPTSMGPLLSWLNNGTDATASGTEDFNGGATTQRDLGLIQLLFQLRDRMYRVSDKLGTVAWHQDAAADLKEVDTLLTAHSSQLSQLTSDVAYLQGIWTLSVYVESRGVAYTPTDWATGASVATTAAIGVTRIAQGIVDISIAPLSYSVLDAIHIQPADRDILMNIAVGTKIAKSPAGAGKLRVALIGNVSLPDPLMNVDSSFWITIHGHAT
jgi:hypothetical protein